MDTATNSIRRTIIPPGRWRSWLTDRAFILGSLESEVEKFLRYYGYADFDNVQWNEETARIYYEVRESI